MALTYSSFGSFDEVVAHYENIKPMGGSGNKGKDIRPIGDRKRKYERIVKNQQQLLRTIRRLSLW